MDEKPLFRVVKNCKKTIYNHKTTWDKLFVACYRQVHGLLETLSIRGARPPDVDKRVWINSFQQAFNRFSQWFSPRRYFSQRPSDTKGFSNFLKNSVASVCQSDTNHILELLKTRSKRTVKAASFT